MGKDWELDIWLELGVINMKLPSNYLIFESLKGASVLEEIV